MVEAGAAVQMRPPQKAPRNATGQDLTKPRFSRLATDCSDENLDFDDEDNGKKPSPSSLGKRSDPDSPPKPTAEHGAPKPFKRLVGQHCLRDEWHPDLGAIQRGSTRKLETTDVGQPAGQKKVSVISRSTKVSSMTYCCYRLCSLVAPRVELGSVVDAALHV